MFDNIGSKIKTLAQVIAWIGIIGSVILGLIFLTTGNEGMALTGILIAVVGSLLSWIGSFIAYGLGQLIENTDKLVVLNGGETNNNSQQSQRSHITPSQNTYSALGYGQNPKEIAKQQKEKEKEDKIKELKQLRSKGLITDEEFFKKLKETK